MAFLKDKNVNGVFLPMICDPKSGKGSVSLTLVFISFNLCVAGIIGKWAGKLGGVDTSQAINLFMICAGLYFGRNLSSNKGNVTVTKEESDKDAKTSN